MNVLDLFSIDEKNIENNFSNLAQELIYRQKLVINKAKFRFTELVDIPEYVDPSVGVKKEPVKQEIA